MKNLKAMLLTTLFAVSSLVIANTEPVKSEENLTKEIERLLKKPAFVVEKQITAYISFTFNDKGGDRSTFC